MDKYAYIIELGNAVEPLEEKFKTPDNIIEGCQSRVWLVADEQDANLRAFKYFNKNVEGFYESYLNYNPNDGKGWNFKKNPLVSKSNNDYSNNYIDYRNKDVMAQVEKSLSIKAMFYHYIPIIPGFFEKLKGNY